MKRLFTLLGGPFKNPGDPDFTITFRDIWFFTRFVKPLWKVGLASFILTLATAGIGALTPLSSKLLIDFTLMKGDPGRLAAALRPFGCEFLAPPLASVVQSLPLIILLGLIFGLSVGLMGIFRSVLSFTFNSRITFNVQTALFDHILRFPLPVLKKRQAGYLMSRLTGDVHSVQSLFSQVMTSLSSNLFTPFFSFFVLFQLNRKVTLILLAVIPVNVLLNYIIMIRTRSLSYRQMEGIANVTGDIQEALSGAEVIKAFGTEERESGKVSAKLKQILRLQLRSTFLSSFSGYITTGSTLVTKLLVLWLTADSVLKGTMTIGDLTSFSWYAMNLSGSLNSLLGQVLSLQYSFVSLWRLRELFAIPGETEGTTGPDEPQVRLPGQAPGEITFEGVSFSYEKGTPVLKNINLAVSPGETIALTGMSGAGKTTLISLILKFYHPRSGVIRFDGTDITDLDTRWLRQQVAIVSQETFLFNDTIENNIKYGRPDATFEEVREAAQRARIDDDILAFEDRYNTLAGERGSRLSIGQKQRISLARAFLCDPALLILDEPSSSLDRETERQLAESIATIARDRTTIIISHRTPMIDLADRVFTLRNRTLVEGQIDGQNRTDETAVLSVRPV